MKRAWENAPHIVHEGYHELEERVRLLLEQKFPPKTTRPALDAMRVEMA